MTVSLEDDEVVGRATDMVSSEAFSTFWPSSASSVISSSLRREELVDEQLEGAAV